MMMIRTNASIPDYLSYPKRFLPYKWYKPLLVLLLGVLVWSLTGGALIFLNPSIIEALRTGATGGGGYDNLDGYTPLGALTSFGCVALFLPALMIANRIVNARPFSSYSSSRGGFNWAAFFKSLGAAVVIFVIPVSIFTVLTEPNTGNIKFTIVGFIACTVLCPLQCAGEEYFCRGFLMQTFGSWFKFPVIAILLQGICFAAMHPYNLIGVASVFTIGIIIGICAYVTKGLEASCALHIVNNMTSFYLAGFGIGGIRTEVSLLDFIIPTCFGLLFLGFIILAKNKLFWYNVVKKEDVALFNAKIEAKREKKANA